MTNEFTHFDQDGNAVMVDVSEKKDTNRTAIATGKIFVSKEIMQAIKAGTMSKGDVLGVARVAGIMAVKQTSLLIPMCHTLLIQNATIDFELDEQKNIVVAVCTVKCEGKTGVEMEALQGVSTALLTIYDMCKALSKEMHLEDIRLLKKTGGKSGTFINEQDKLND